MRIIVWYHCVISGPRIPNGDYAIQILQEQMSALSHSGLADMADEIHIGVNGGDSDALLVSAFCPDKSQLHVHGPFATSELSTLHQLRQGLHPDELVLYHHIKGVQYPDNHVFANWRRCMQRHCVYGWRDCVKELESGADTVGVHWMTQRKYPMVGKDQRYWGGNFWWANSNYLITLRPPPFDQWEKRYDAEVWIGWGKSHPRVVDFADHFPMKCPPS